jgi:hypothetical protein
MSKKAVSGRMPSISPFGPSATCSSSAGTGNVAHHGLALCVEPQATRSLPVGRNPVVYSGD